MTSRRALSRERVPACPVQLVTLEPLLVPLLVWGSCHCLHSQVAPHRLLRAAASSQQSSRTTCKPQARLSAGLPAQWAAFEQLLDCHKTAWPAKAPR